MATGTIVSYDPEEGTGYVVLDHSDDRIPFDDESLSGYAEGQAPRAGEPVSFDVEGGLAGVWAKNVRPARNG